MDRELRELHRRAAEGDRDAALQYFYAHLRVSPRNAQQYNYEEILEVHQPHLFGHLGISPLTGQSIAMYTPVDHYLSIYNVEYTFSGRYYYYPELGWCPFLPDTVVHARSHLEARESYHSKMGGPPTASHPDAERIDLMTYLPPLNQGPVYHCHLCDKVLERGFSGRRFYPPTGRTMSTAAATLLDAYLRRVCETWTEENQDKMILAQLAWLNSQIISTNKFADQIRSQLIAIERTLADYIIEEIRLQNRQA